MNSTGVFASLSFISIRGVFACLMAIIIAGCATPRASDPRQVAKRRVERPGAYEALSAEDKSAVDQGQLRTGLPEDAVYIAWGKPAQVLQSGGQAGETTTWLYHGTTADSYTGWRFREVIRPNGSSYIDQFPDVNYNFRDYISAELTFRSGRLESWRTLPSPPSQSFQESRGMGGWPYYR